MNQQEQAALDERMKEAGMIPVSEMLEVAHAAVYGAVMANLRQATGRQP